MKKLNWTPIIVACIIMVGTLVGMSLVIKPSTVEAGEIIEEIEHAETGEITMQGFAQVESEPNQVVINLRIRGIDKDSAAAAKDIVAEIIDKVLKSLKKLGLEDDDIETTSYNIHLEYEWINRKKVFKGYLVTCNIKVTVKDFDKAGRIIDTSVDAGALVDGITFELSMEKQEELKTQVMAEAAKDAKEKAEAVVSALGQNLGKAKRVSLDYGYQPYPYWKSGSLAYSNIDGEIPPTTIMPRDLIVSAKISIVFEIL